MLRDETAQSRVRTDRSDYLRLRAEGYDSEAAYWGNKASALAKQIPSVAAGRALDLGCGQGRNISALSDRGFTVVGVDSIEAACSTARRVAPSAAVVAADAVDYLESCGSETVDLVFANHLIQHFESGRLNAFLNYCDRVLLPGGVLAIGHFIEHPAHPTVVAESALLLPACRLRQELSSVRGYEVLHFESTVIDDEHPGFPPHLHAVERTVVRKRPPNEVST